MATAKYGALVSDISGSIGSVTFRRNNGGAIITNRVSKCGQPSESQRQQQIRFSQLHAAWRGYSDTVRFRWAAHATIVASTMGIGTGKKTNGFLCFTQYCMERHFFWYAIPTSIPAPYRSEPITSVYTNLDLSNALIINAFHNTYNVYNYVIIQACRSFRSYAIQPNNWKTVSMPSQNVSPAYDVTTGFHSVWGVPSLGEYISVRVRVFRESANHDPWASAWTYGSGFVVA
jgi:hypothetical protein